MESSVFGVIRMAAGRFSWRFDWGGQTIPEELLHAARVLLWVRWFGLGAAFVEIHYRVDYWSSATFSIRSTAWGSWRPTGTCST